MKKKFSKSWIGSKQIRKQRKYRENAPLHIATKMMSCNLSKDLRKKYSKRNIPIRKDDEVKVMRGEFKKKEGKINIVDKKRFRVTLEGIQRKKKDGSKVNVYFHPSNLMIKSLNLNDKKRIIEIDRKIPSKKEKVEKKESTKSTNEKTKINKEKVKNAPKKKPSK